MFCLQRQIYQYQLHHPLQQHREEINAKKLRMEQQSALGRAAFKYAILFGLVGIAAPAMYQMVVGGQLCFFEGDILTNPQECSEVRVFRSFYCCFNRFVCQGADALNQVSHPTRCG